MSAKIILSKCKTCDTPFQHEYTSGAAKIYCDTHKPRVVKGVNFTLTIDDDVRFMLDTLRNEKSGMKSRRLFIMDMIRDEYKKRGLDSLQETPAL
jgi:hypothetical protein